MSEEGTSSHYPLANKPSASLALLNDLKKYLELETITSTTGQIWTTDAPYRETHGKIKKYLAQGVNAVDMEFTALLTVAEYRNVSLAAVMVVSDLLSGSSWVSGFSSKVFKKKCRAVAEAIFTSCLRGEL